jgi:hypothetical protein
MKRIKALCLKWENKVKEKIREKVKEEKKKEKGEVKVPYLLTTY